MKAAEKILDAFGIVFFELLAGVFIASSIWTNNSDTKGVEATLGVLLLGAGILLGVYTAIKDL